MIIKILAALGIIFIFICLSLVLAAIMTKLEDPTTEEENEEQMQYIMQWKENRDRFKR